MSFEETDSSPEASPLSSAEAFSARAEAIRRRHSEQINAVSVTQASDSRVEEGLLDDPDTFDEYGGVGEKDTVRPESGDSMVEKFPEGVRLAIRDLVTTAKHCMRIRDRVDFYRLYRELREEERQRGPAEKLLLLPRLSVYLSGRRFRLANEPWIVNLCSESQLNAEVPVVSARKEHSGTSFDQLPPPEKISLIEILAGLDI